MIPREASLAVEGCLGVALATAYLGMLMRGPRGAALAQRALLGGGIAALLAAVLTLRSDAVWFFDALRVDTLTQTLKGLVASGVIVIALRRPVAPFFILVAATGLTLAAGAGDLLVLWVALDIASAAVVLAVATGSESVGRMAEVRRLVFAWLPMSLLMLLGIIMTAGLAGSTRLTDIETVLPSMRGLPIAVAGVTLITISILLRGARYIAVVLRG